MRPPEFHDDLERGIDYYELLRVRDLAEGNEIRAAFRVRILEVHPDQGGDHVMAATLLRARETLTGPDRPAYDAARSAKAREAHERFLRAEEAKRNASSWHPSPRTPASPGFPEPAPREEDPTIRTSWWDDHAERTAGAEHAYQAARVLIERERRARVDAMNRAQRERDAMWARAYRPAAPSSSFQGRDDTWARDFLRTDPPSLDELTRRLFENNERLEQEIWEERDALFRRIQQEREALFRKVCEEREALFDRIREDREAMLRASRAATERILRGSRYPGT